MEGKENWRQWIDFVCDEWLPWIRKQKNGTHLRESTCNMISRMNNALDHPSKTEQAWNMLERLKRLANTIGSLDDDSSVTSYRYEPSEIYLECALAAYHMDDSQEALRLFEMPIGSFPSRSLQKAVCYWLRGCIRWQFQSNVDDALVDWEISRHIVKEVKSDKIHDANTSKKCEEMILAMTNAINRASQDNFPPAPPSSGPANSGTRSRNKPVTLRTFPVIGNIPAGTPAEVLPPEEDELAINVVELRGECYRVVSLRGENLIWLSQSKFYYVLKVTGESMDNASPVNIKNGDYVLMVQQEEATNGDIVAVEILGVDRLASLKRYRLERGKPVFRPESNHPDFQVPIPAPHGFLIRGVAIALLEPEDKQP